MRSTTRIAFISVTILSTSIGCTLAARVDRDEIPDEKGGAGGSAGGKPSSSSSSSSSTSSGTSTGSSSSGQAGMGGSGGAGGMAGMGGAGGAGPCVLDSDCPPTSTVCELPYCNAGVCQTKPEVAGTECKEGTGTMCDGQGSCVECLARKDCPVGTACETADCNAGVCGFVVAPEGTIVGDPMPGDCMNEQCDAMGMVVKGIDDLDLPIPANQCKVGLCSMGTPMTADAPTGTPCGVANTLCDGAGNCVGCTLDIHCGMPTECNTPTCANMTCVGNFTAAGTVLMAQTAHDCKVAQCDGSGGISQVPNNMDLPLDDGNPCTDQVCIAGMPDFPASSVGIPCGNGLVCDGTGMCVECNLGVDCASGICSMNACQPPQVVSIAPADMATNASVSSSIAITFSGTMNAMTLVGQTSTGPCTGSVQFSVDDFATCYGFALASPTMSPDKKVATFVPAPGLSFGTTYKVKVTTGVQDISGKALAADVTQAMGFTTEVPQSTCSGSVVISQIYGSGGLAGAAYLNDFVELHNRGNTTADVTGWTVQYSSATGTTWSGPTLSGTIAPGGYYLVQLASGGAIGLPLPTPNATGTNNISAQSGKVALVGNSSQLAGACPMGPQIKDFVGFGAMANCFEGAAPAGQPSATQSIFRKGAGCTDTTQNGTDTELLNAAPRNNATMALQCDCPVTGNLGTANESGLKVEMDYCNVQFPPNITITAGQPTPPIYGRVYEPGFTEFFGADAAITAQIGFGPANVNPETQSGYQFFPAAYNVQVNNDDEYVATLTPAMAGSYRYVYRFTRDGVSYTYCDKNGSGSNAGLSFEIHELPVLTVMP